MSTPEIKNAGFPASVNTSQQPTVSQPPAEARVAVSEPPKTGIYNIQSEEGRQAIQRTLLDLGLTMPEFLSGADSKFVANLPKQAKDGLIQLGQSAAALTSAGTTSPQATADLQGRWADYVSGQNVTGFMDVNALVQFVLREAYMENTKDLHFYAQKVRFYNDLKKLVREELTKAREHLSKQAGKKPEDNLTSNYTSMEFPTEPKFDQATGAMVPHDPQSSTSLKNKEELETYIKNLEEKLNSIGDDAQLANVDLQNMLQKQQQTLQMMSNISKMLHDTAMAIIRKIGS